MNYEQFTYWVLGFAEARERQFPVFVEIKRMHQQCFGVQEDKKSDVSYEHDELDQFMNLSNIPVEENLPEVGSEIQDSSNGNWEKSDESELK